MGLAADVGSLQRLPRQTASSSLLYELALTARNFGPAEALTLGLVSKVVPGGREGVLTAALATAKIIACESKLSRIISSSSINLLLILIPPFFFCSDSQVTRSCGRHEAHSQLLS